MLNKEKINEITYLILPVIISAGIILSITNPTLLYIKDVKEKIRSQHRELEVKYENAKHLKSNSVKIKQLQDRLVILDDIFITQDHELDFITTLEDVATKHNVEQKINLIPKPTSKNKKQNQPDFMSFSIETIGNYNDTLAWLLEVEQLTYYINFTSMHIGTTNIGKNNVILKINGKVYTTKI